MTTSIQGRASLDSLELFVAVADAGGFSRAADVLDLPVATLSRKIALLEKELNIPLFKRNTRNVSLTAAGEVFYTQLTPALAAVQLAVNDLSDASDSIQGMIRVTAPSDFARHCLVPSLAKFLRVNPDVQMDLNLNSMRMDLVKEHVDLAIRIGQLEDSNLVAWHLFDMPLKLYAAPTYLASLLQTQHPDDLKHCNFVNLKTNHSHNVISLQNRAETFEFSTNSNISANDMGVIIALCCEGAGVGLLPEMFVQQEISEGKLMPVLPSWFSTAAPIHAVSTARNPPVRIRRLIEHFKNDFKQWRETTVGR